jgi:tetratricopeptide (TPR) repeat protein
MRSALAAALLFLLAGPAVACKTRVECEKAFINASGAHKAAQEAAMNAVWDDVVEMALHAQDPEDRRAALTWLDPKQRVVVRRPNSALNVRLDPDSYYDTHAKQRARVVSAMREATDGFGGHALAREEEPVAPHDKLGDTASRTELEAGVLREPRDFEAFFQGRGAGDSSGDSGLKRLVQEASDRQKRGDTKGTGAPKTEEFISAVRRDPRALPVIEREAERRPEDPDAQAALALARLVSGDEEGAREAAGKAAALDRDHPLARAVIGRPDELRAAGSRLAGIKNPFDTSRAAPSAGDDGAVRAVFTPAQRGAAGKKLAAMAAGVSLGMPPETKAQELLAEAVEKLSTGDFSGALFSVSRALMLDPKNVRARVLRAHISNLPKNKNYPAAIKDADEALGLDPRNAAALFEKGYAHLQLGQTREALAAIEEGLKLEPDNAMGRLYHAMALEKAGLVAQAIDEYRRAEKLDPALAPLVQDALARLMEVKGSMPNSSRGVPVKYVLWALFAAMAAALLLEGGKRVFYKDWKTSIAAKPDAAPPMTARGTLAPGVVLGGNFRIERELARGGIGIVYEAVDLTLQRPVAIKHLSAEAYASGEVRDRFLKEAQLAARLKHPNLAQIFSVVSGDELYLVFELLEGETLHQALVKRRRFELSDLKPLMSEVCAAVDYAHSQGIIHRDLKPANIMLTPDGHAKVMDFGIAKETKSPDLTQTQAWGTPVYMAPEQESGAVCKESDLYALGIMIYELVAGERPFQGAYSLDRKLKKDYRPIKHANPDAPGELHAFFQKALEPDPKARFRSAGEMARALDAIQPTPIRG